jgi:hypothetical protein
MRRLEETVVQLEEAKRFILTGTTPYLRLALLLLDNAAEVLMHRTAADELERAATYAGMLKVFDELPVSSDPKRVAFRESLSVHTISDKRRALIGRFFEEKTKFLSEDRGLIPRPVARVLTHIHYYRNEAYHLDKVRSESLRPAVLVLFDVVCLLLTSLDEGTTVWESNDDYSWLDRYGLKRFGARDELAPAIATALRVGLALDVLEVRSAVIAHLADRVDGMEQALNIVAEVIPDGQSADVLKAVQYCEEGSAPMPRRLHDRGELYQRFQPRFTLGHFQHWRRAVDRLSKVDDKFELFNRFADIEDEFEPLERMLDDVASAVEREIDLQIDIMRGK